MATDRNDALLAEILGELRGFGAALGDIRDRLPAQPAPASADGGEPVVVDIREPQLPVATADSIRVAEPAKPARKSPAKRAPSKES